MNSISSSKVFEIPKFYYFECGNKYTGSKEDFNYKIIPGDELIGQIWYGNLCSEKATIEQEVHFPMQQEGFEKLITWLEQCYASQPL